MSTPTDRDFREQCLAAARRAGDWFVNTQVPNYKWRRTADEGRFWYNYYRPYRNGHRSTVWTTATAAMSLLALHRRTGEEKYRVAARQGIEYLKTIQILDARDQRVFGTFHEHTMRTEFVYPRDAVTGAWGMLSLYVYEGRKEEDLLYRSKIYADWLWRSAWDRDWRWIYDEYNLETHRVVRRLSNFQGGAGAWFYHLYRVTGEERYLQDGLLPLADGTLQHFLTPEGSFRLEYDPDKKAWEQGTGEGMHAWNDDYVCTALLCAYKATGEAKYLDRVRAFAKWLLGQQNPDGSMGKTPAAAATSILLFDQLDAIRPEPELMASARRAAGWLFANQVTDEPDVNLHGGMTDEDFTRDYVGTRTTSYALSALLKLENRANPVFFSAEDFLR
jgi:hypothetical protein